MRFDEEVKLDFSDVLIKPKRSRLSSRKDVDITRTFKNPDGSTWDCVPIIAANMDSVGSFEMAAALDKHQCMTALHKHYSVSELVNFFQNNNTDNVFYSMGTSAFDMEKLLYVQKHLDKGLGKICIDVANGYSEKFLNFVLRMVEKNPSIFIMAGNVVTADVTEQLILSGVSSVKIGIGPGCFVKDTQVTTIDGVKNIQDIKIGDSVLTHNNTFESVISTMSRPASKMELLTINGVTCTKNHEFLVINSKDKDKVTDENYLDFAVWLPADKLDETHFLIEL